MHFKIWRCRRWVLPVKQWLALRCRCSLTHQCDSLQKRERAKRESFNPFWTRLSVLCKSFEIDSRSGECVTSRLSQVGGFQLASPTSRPGSVLMYETWILLGSEAASIHASQFKALAQGCQVIGDGALLLERAGLPLENCPVPGIVAFGDSIYLAPSAFPVFCLLSSPMSMSSRAGIASIASWIVFLRDFVAETARLLKASTGTMKPQSACYLMPVGASCPPRLQQNLFYKPIRLRNFPPQNSGEMHGTRAPLPCGDDASAGDISSAFQHSTMSSVCDLPRWILTNARIGTG